MPPKKALDRFRRETARRLRTNATDAEKRLWRMLRQLPTFGSHFRRQVPIGPYVVDFACMAAHMVIEVDGSQHGNKENVKRDEKRTQWLKSEGYEVVRFWNNDVSRNMDGILEAIYTALYGQSTPNHFKHSRRPKASNQSHDLAASHRLVDRAK